MRKTETITITREGRDKNKVFKITEMAADQQERWAIRAFFAMANNGVELPEGVEELGMGGLVSMGLSSLGKIKYEDAEPLLKEMQDCVEFVPDPEKPGVTHKMLSEVIEEVSTYFTLRKAVLGLHTGFFSLEENST